jgi:uncharacterized protein (TIGR00725 family)
MRKLQIAVLGSSKIICTRKMYQFAEEVGEELAKRDCVTLTGGGLGVMEAALKGAKNFGGTTLAIVPWENTHMVNDYADVVVATGIGWSRNSINLNSCDGAIIVGGGAGTLNEATYAYMQGKPIVAISDSGGMAKEIAGEYLDKRKTELVYDEKTAIDAVNKILELIKETEKRERKLSELDKQLLESEEKFDWKFILKRRTKEHKKRMKHAKRHSK